MKGRIGRWGFIVLWARITWLSCKQRPSSGARWSDIFTDFYRNPMFVAAFIRMCHWTVSWVRNLIPTSSF